MRTYIKPSVEVVELDNVVPMAMSSIYGTAQFNGGVNDEGSTDVALIKGRRGSAWQEYENQ